MVIKNKTKQRGYGVLVSTLGVVLAGFFMTSYWVLTNSSGKDSEIRLRNLTLRKMNRIQRELVGHVVRKGSLPCPASLPVSGVLSRFNDKIANENKVGLCGTSQYTGFCPLSTYHYNWNTTSIPINYYYSTNSETKHYCDSSNNRRYLYYSSFVPMFTINLSKYSSVDAWGREIEYTVGTPFLTSCKNSKSTQLDCFGDGNTSLTDLLTGVSFAYVLKSHGKVGAGSYNAYADKLPNTGKIAIGISGVADTLSYQSGVHAFPANIDHDNLYYSDYDHITIRFTAQQIIDRCNNSLNSICTNRHNLS